MPLEDLGQCQGDCNSDDDCKAGMMCFQRELGQPVPGCATSGFDDSDYCVGLGKNANADEVDVERFVHR